LLFDIVTKGNAEWEDSNQTSLRIIWKTPESLAGEVYNWAVKQDLMGTVFTIFELHAGEEHQDSGTE
jgi:ESCRT-II complex subunit VPS25